MKTGEFTEKSERGDNPPVDNTDSNFMGYALDFVWTEEASSILTSEKVDLGEETLVLFFCLE